MIRSSQFSILTKLTILYTLTTFSGLIVIFLAAYWITSQAIITAEKQYIIDEIHLMQNLLSQHPNQLTSLTQEVNAVPEALKTAKYHYYIRVYDKSNTTLMQTPHMMKAIPDAKFLPINEKHWKKQVLHWKNQAGKHLISMSAPIQFNRSGQADLFMDMILDGTYPEQLIDQYQYKALLFLFALIILLLLLNRIITRHGLKGLYELVHITEKTNAKRLASRIQTHHWPKELVLVGNSFNNMLERIENAFQRISECTTDLAHELRTPLNNLMLATEIILSRERKCIEYQQVLASNLEEYHHLISIIENILFLSRLDNQQIPLNKVPIDLAQETQALCEFFSITAAEKAMTIETQATGFIHADLTLFRRIMSNLIGNAIQYTPNQGKVLITTEFDDDWLHLRVIDNGVGIAKDHLDYIFERFYRAEAKNNINAGIGIGLSIVHSIITLHQAKITIFSEPGRGTTVLLSFAV